MRWERDVTADAMYVYVNDGDIHHSEELPDGTVVDVAASGELVGVEILTMSSGWNSDALVHRFTLSAYELEALQAITRPPGMWGSREESISPPATLPGSQGVQAGSTSTNLVGAVPA